MKKLFFRLLHMAQKFIKNAALFKNLNLDKNLRFCRLLSANQSYVIENISNELTNTSKRLFAVIYINEKQFKVSQDDIIHLEGNVPLDVGERIKLEKVSWFILFFKFL